MKIEVLPKDAPGIEKRRYRWVILLWAFLLDFFVNGFSSTVMAPLLPEISVELGLTHSRIGLIWGAQALGVMLFSLIGGNLGDRFGTKRVISTALIGAAIFCSARAWFPSFWALATTMLLFGISLAFIVPNLTKAMGQWFGPAELATANGLLIVGVSSGAAVGLMLGASVLSPALGGWKGVMWLTGGINFALLLGWVIQAKEPSSAVGVARPRLKPAGFLEGLKRILTIRDLWLLAILELCVVAGWIAWIGMFPDILVSRGMSAGMAGLLVSIGVWASTAGNIIGPYASDHFRTRKLFIWPSLLLVAVSWSLQGFVTGAPLVSLIVLVGVGVGITIPLFRTVALEIEGVGPDFGGSAIGFVFTLNRFGAFVWPIVMGMLMDYTGLHWPPLELLGLLGFIGVGLTLFVKETGSKSLAKMAHIHK